MAEFMIQFFLCNIVISMTIGILQLVKHLLRNILTSRMQYNLWYVLLGLLAVPFLPVQPARLPQIFSWLGNFRNASSSPAGTAVKETASQNLSAANWMNDFSISVSKRTPSAIGRILFAVWVIGMFVMILRILKSMLRFHRIKSSALPLQNPAVRRLYDSCLEEMHIKRPVPIYSTAFLKSPVIAGLFRPCIYLPIHLISDYHANDIKYMLLHELAHYKYKDALANYFMNIMGVLYWFHPLVWFSLREMKNEREIACDTSVLMLLDENACEDYGNTLLNLAKKVSLTPFPFVAGISGSRKHMQKRILNIANYHPVSLRKALHSAALYSIIAFLLLGTAPILSTQASEQNRYYWNESDRTITYLDLKDTFGDYHGSFVLYDAAADSWQIYQKDNATTRIAPASTYKIYSALFGLDSGIITPEQSRLPWNGQSYPYNLWNADQTLESAMQNSVTWYFQELDRKTGLPAIKKYIREIGYGNQIIKGDASSYWINSSLKISPVEQVELLKKLYYNQFGFAPTHMKTVKDSICLSSTAEGSLFGKTGTEEVNGENTSGWFIGYVEKGPHPCFFATNIQSDKLASGPLAAELTFSILFDLKIWNTYPK